MAKNIISYDPNKLEKNKAKMIYVDEWQPTEDQILFRYSKNSIILPIANYYKMNYAVGETPLDHFIMSPKRCYNKIKDHFCRYLNYFESYYDREKELFVIYAKIKFILDYNFCTKEDFFQMLDLYIFRNAFLKYKVRLMNEDNYRLSLAEYKNEKDPILCYTNVHGKLLMELSLFQKLIIPLISHYIYTQKIPKHQIEEFILESFDLVVRMYDDNVDVVNKIFETALSKTANLGKENSLLFDKQEIRQGKTVTIHSLDSMESIFICLSPKYIYALNPVAFNYRSIHNNVENNITDIGYEYDYIKLNSSDRDEDNNSPIDKFEAYLIKQDEELYIQNKVNFDSTMERIKREFGPFDNDEIKFYYKELTKNNKNLRNMFQENLILNLFYKYFGDPRSSNGFNNIEYIIMMLAAKKLLINSSMVILPEIISGRITRFINKKNMNKKELFKLSNSSTYAEMQKLYNGNPKIEAYIQSIIASIISSEFQIISYTNPDINGLKIDTIPEYVCEEVCLYVTMI